MFIAVLFIIVKHWKQCKCPSTGEWRNKLWHIYIRNCFSAVKLNELLIHTAAWMFLKIIMQSKRSQTQRTIYFMIPFTWNFRTEKNKSDRKQMGGCQGWRIEEGLNCKGAQGYFWGQWNYLSSDCTGNCITVGICQN